MYKAYILLIAIVLSALIGAATGWLFSSITLNRRLAVTIGEAQNSEGLREERKQAALDLSEQNKTDLSLHELRIVGEDGKLCLRITGSSLLSADNIPLVGAYIYFYDTNSNITHVIGVNNGHMYILSKNKDGSDNWGIREPDTSFNAR
jgi:hypothetical protein